MEPDSLAKEDEAEELKRCLEEQGLVVALKKEIGVIGYRNPKIGLLHKNLRLLFLHSHAAALITESYTGVNRHLKYALLSFLNMVSLPIYSIFHKRFENLHHRRHPVPRD